MRTKDKLYIVCGLSDGGVEMRATNNDLRVISLFEIHPRYIVRSICELDDGTFVSGSDEKTVKRWNSTGEVLQEFSELSTGIRKVIQLNSDVIIAAALFTSMMWRLSTGQPLREVTLHSGAIYGMVKLSDDKFATGDSDRKIRVWNETQRECIEAVSTNYNLQAMIRVRDTIVTANREQIEARRLK